MTVRIKHVCIHLTLRTALSLILFLFSHYTGIMDIGIPMYFKLRYLGLKMDMIILKVLKNVSRRWYGTDACVLSSSTAYGRCTDSMGTYILLLASNDLRPSVLLALPHPGTFLHDSFVLNRSGTPLLPSSLPLSSYPLLALVLSL